MTLGLAPPLTLDLAPTLTIGLSIGTECEIKVWLKDQETPAMTVKNPGLSQAKLGTLRGDVRERVSRVCTLLTTGLLARDPKISIRDSMTALCELHECGYYILQQLFGEEARNKLPQLRQCARDACPGWANPKWNRTAALPNLIVVKTSVDNGIPVDILPLLDFDPPREPEYENLGKLACSFLGFSAIVKRQLGSAIGSSRPIENIPKLPMKMFIHRGLRGARQEEATFRDNPEIDAEPGWPNESEPSQADFPRALAKQLWEPDTRFGRGPRNLPDQICHFSCHSNTGMRMYPSNYEIHLQSGRFTGRRKVNLQALTNELSRLGMENSNDRRPRPLIFLNSCGSGDLDPSGAGSFPELFLKRDLGFMGFIGTETSVPDDFAAEFSRCFYEHLLSGRPIGRALLAARWQLLRLYQNPLGLLYTLFAEPEIHVRRPVSQFSQTVMPIQASGTGSSRFFANLRRMVTPQRPARRFIAWPGSGRLPA